MQLEEAKRKFIEAWGKHGSAWGINKTMAHIHALLFVSEKPLSTDDLMDKLQISRGNANMNVRSLISWGLVHKEFLDGGRKEYFVAEKDVWLMAKCIVDARRKEEVAPLLETLSSLREIDVFSKEADAFQKDIKDLQKLTQRVDKVFSRIVKNGDSKVVNTIAKMLK